MTASATKKNSENSTPKLTSKAILKWIKEGLILERRSKENPDGTRRLAGPHFYAREGGGCNLRSYFRRLDYPVREEDNPRYIDLARRGEAIESIVLGALGYGSGLACERQARASKQYTVDGQQLTIVGRADGLIPGVAAIEVKSLGDEYIRAIRGYDDCRRDRPSYIDQCVIYADMFDVPAVYLILCSRDDHRYRCFHIRPSPGRVKEILTELAKTEEAIQKKEAPAPRPGYECYFCPYWDYCPAWGGEAQAPTEVSLPPNNQGEIRT